MREIDISKWNRLLSLWESRKSGQPSALLKNEEQVNELIEILQYLKQYTAFDSGSALAIGVYENSSEWRQGNPNRPRWNLSARITTPKQQMYAPPPNDDEELPFVIDDKGKVKPKTSVEETQDKKKMPWD